MFKRLARFAPPFKSGWRMFYTQQHDDNFTWEILQSPNAQDFRCDD